MTYRLLVYVGPDVEAQGTGFFVRPDVVITAFHVVGSLAAGYFWNETDEEVVYRLDDHEGITLEPLVFDREADLALLRAAPARPDAVLGLAPAAPRRNAPWHGRGFPDFHGGNAFTMSGTVVDLHGHDPASALQLHVEQGTQVSWAGVSGTPVCDDSGVRGVITQVTDNTSTGWAASVSEVRRLLDRLDVLTQGTPAHDPVRGRSRLRLRNNVLNMLRDRNCIGIALIEALGFGARYAVDDVIAALARPGEEFLPIRLVPDRSSTNEARLYRKLARDLADGLERALGAQGREWSAALEVRAQTDDEARDGFERAVEDLVRGPLRNAGRTLVLCVDGLARMPWEQLVQWGYLAKRLADQGMKLLMWGGRDLHELRTRPGDISAFHMLHPIRMARLELADVEDLARESLGRDVAARVHAATGGHPGLVRELLAQPAEMLTQSTAEQILDVLLRGTHIERVRRELERDAEMSDVLRSFVAHGQGIPRALFNEIEAKLGWLGVVIEHDNGWQWSAPVMQRLARWLAERTA